MRSGANCRCVSSRSTAATAMQYGTETRAAITVRTSLLEKWVRTVL
jgi:hypothetical protein